MFFLHKNVYTISGNLRGKLTFMQRVSQLKAGSCSECISNGHAALPMPEGSEALIPGHQTARSRGNSQHYPPVPEVPKDAALQYASAPDSRNNSSTCKNSPGVNSGKCRANWTESTRNCSHTVFRSHISLFAFGLTPLLNKNLTTATRPVRQWGGSDFQVACSAPYNM